MRFIFTLFSCMILTGLLYAQDTLTIAAGQENAGLLETTINSDVDGNGDRLHPNRVYKLLNGIHFQLSAINVDNPDGTIKIVGETGGKKPVIIPIATNDIDPGTNIINGNLEIRNIHYQGKNDIGGTLFSRFELQGLNRRLTVEDCLFEFAQHQLFLADGVTQGLVLEFRNNYFRDLFWDDQWWASRVFQAKVPIDTLIFENNTVTGSGMALLQQEAVCRYALINHNSFINNHAYVLLNNYYFEGYFTNNLFINSQIKGEDFTVIQLEPDAIPTDIMGLDTIDTDILLADDMVDGSGNLLAPYNDIGNYKIYVADNIYYNEPVLDDYYNGTYNDLFDAPVSYLNWFGPGPHEVEVPTPWMNSRALALHADWDNIVEENNILNTDPQLSMPAITPEVANELAIWNRILYEVPDETGIPDLSGYYFGDNDPTTIPGIETEDGDGITKFSDLIEDLSISSSFTSNIDGHTIGAVHWTDEIESFDSEASLAAILEAYDNALSAAEQDTIEIPAGQENAGLLETTINSDVDDDGNRKHPNRVYKLLNGIHFQLSAINVDNPDGTIKIVGETGGKKPVVIPIATNDIDPGTNIINGNLEIRNIHYQAKNDIGGTLFSRFELQGLNRRLTVEDCLFEFAQHQLFLADGVTQGLVLEFRNNYFRDLFWDDQWWASRVFQAKVPIDTLIFENNTVTGSGMALLQQEAVCRYALINHNSFINNHAYVLLNNYYFEGYFTNNLFLNSQIKGEDFTVIQLEPDAIPTDIMGLDTIDTDILLADDMVDGSGNLLYPYNDIGQYKIFVSNNLYYNEPVLNDYYNGTYNDVFDAPVSYLNWFGPGPHRVEVPTPWMNSRALALHAEHNNIVEENTILNTDPQLNTVAITPEVANELAIWNRILYEVPDETGIPDLTDYYFGDNDPTTIPGIETEDGDGITKFSDLIEDLSINPEFVSTLDGHTIGALHWTNEINMFDPEESLNDILDGYENALSLSTVVADDFALVQNYPNPFNQSTTIEYTLERSAEVTLEVFNLVGEKIATLVNDKMPAGTYKVDFEAQNLPSGIYFYTLRADNTRLTQKMLHLK